MKKSFFSYYAFPIFWILFFLSLGFFLSGALLPLVTAFFLAYLLHPVIVRLNKLSVPQHVAIGVTFALAIMGLVGVLSVAIPQFIHLISVLIRDLPNLGLKALNTVEKLADSWDIPFHVETDRIIFELRHYLQSISFSTLSTMTGLLQKTVFNLIEVVFWVFKLLFFPVFFYYALLYYQSTKNEIKSFFPPRVHPHLAEFSQIAGRVLSGYIRGQLVVCSILACYYSLSFWLLGLRFGIVIGILTGFAYMVPYVGIASAFLFGIGMYLANFVSPVHLIFLLGVYTVGQCTEAFFLTPRITGNRVGLEPFITILVLIIGANLFGFLGVVVAIPVSGICREYYFKLKALYHQSEFFLEP